MPTLKRCSALAAFIVLVLCGCAKMRFSQYTGTDASSVLGTWPTSQGSMAETSFKVPVYRGWPERPYRVLGSLSHPNPNASWNKGDIAWAARTAKKRDGDAIVIRQGAEYGVSQIAGGASGQATVLATPYVTSALVIRWLTDAELKEMQYVRDEYLKEFYIGHPSVRVANTSVGELMLTLLLQRSLDLRSEELKTQFLEEMAKLVSESPANLEGRWVFKASLAASTITSSGDEKNFLGIAKVSVQGESVAIVSTDGTVELNVSGELSRGRLSGQIGIGSVSSKCEGAATADKISLNFLSRTPDSTVRGNVTLQRLISQPHENEKSNSGPDSGV